MNTSNVTDQMKFAETLLKKTDAERGPAVTWVVKSMVDLIAIETELSSTPASDLFGMVRKKLLLCSYVQQSREAAKLMGVDEAGIEYAKGVAYQILSSLQKLSRDLDRPDEPAPEITAEKAVAVFDELMGGLKK
jgi:hypothetical protein